MSTNTSWTDKPICLSFDPARLAELTLSLIRAMQLTSPLQANSKLRYHQYIAAKSAIGLGSPFKQAGRIMLSSMIFWFCLFSWQYAWEILRGRRLPCLRGTSHPTHTVASLLGSKSDSQLDKKTRRL